MCSRTSVVTLVLTVDKVEVHRVLSEGDAAAVNRARRDPAMKYLPGETCSGFDSEGDALGAGRAVAESDGATLEDDWPRFVVVRRDGAWVPIGTDEVYG